VVAEDMAYFFWEDEGIALLLDEFEPDFVATLDDLPANVERTDVFRILVLKWFGGIVSIFRLFFHRVSDSSFPDQLYLVCRRRYATSSLARFVGLFHRRRPVDRSRHGHGIFVDQRRGPDSRH
jgi:hypothetical protein